MYVCIHHHFSDYSPLFPTMYKSFSISYYLYVLFYFLPFSTISYSSPTIFYLCLALISSQHLSGALIRGHSKGGLAKVQKSLNI